jgi:hypothetical protein
MNKNYLFYIIICISACFFGCKEVENKDLEWSSWEGENFTFHTKGSLPIEGTFYKIDKTLEKIQEALELPLLKGVKINYFYYNDNNEYSIHCPFAFTNACVKEATIHALKVPAINELFIAVLNASYGEMHLFFSQAIALALTSFKWDIFDWEPEEIRKQLEMYMVPNLRLDDFHSLLPGYFVFELIEKFGLEAVLAVSSSTKSDSTRQEIDQLFFKVFDKSLDDILDEFIDSLENNIYWDACLLSDVKTWNEKESKWVWGVNISKNSNDIYQLQTSELSSLTIKAEKKIIIPKTDFYNVETLGINFLSMQKCETPIHDPEELFNSFYYFMVMDDSVSISINEDGQEHIKYEKIEIFKGTYSMFFTQLYNNQNDLFNANDYKEIKIYPSSEE